MKFENTRVYNFDNAIRGMRNPLNSWAKSDSLFYTIPDEYHDYSLDDWLYEQLEDVPEEDRDRLEEELYNKAVYYNYQQFCECHQVIAIGKKDMQLAQNLIKAGTSDRKFLREILVSVNITAPLFWWKEFDTYKVGTVANSTSTMHKLATTPITLGCFEQGNMELKEYPAYAQRKELKSPIDTDFIQMAFIPYLEYLRQKYNETKDVMYWRELIRWLPNGWLQMRTITLSYENLRAMYSQRKNHKLTEWREDFVNWINTLPYAEEFIKS